MPNDATPQTAEPDGDGFRARARALRSASRARLAEFRAARAARRKLPAPESPVEPSASASDSESAPNLNEAVAAFEADVPEAGVAEEAPERLDAPAEAAVPDAVEPSRPALETQSADADVEGDDVPRALADLPGVGPGLIWLFEEAGVRSLGDLAAADPNVLRARLGVLGALLDLESWIALAKMAARDG